MTGVLPNWIWGKGARGWRTSFPVFLEAGVFAATPFGGSFSECIVVAPTMLELIECVRYEFSGSDAILT